MNSREASYRTSFLSLWTSAWRHRSLIFQITRRDVTGRYRGSIAGLAWSLFNPVLMLGVYTFVFSVVMRSRWPALDQQGGESHEAQFALVLFVGLIVHGFFAEVVTRAPSLILGNVNYVKKVVFPLEVLPIISLGAAAFHGLVSLGVLLLAFAAVNGYLHWTAVFAPLIFLPLAILMLGLAWILASLGTFLRDVSQFIGIVTTMLLFLSPVFYPISALPPAFHGLILANPLTFIIEQERDVLIWGKLPDWTGLATYTLLSLLFTHAGYAWFQKTRKGFADVL